MSQSHTCPNGHAVAPTDTTCPSCHTLLETERLPPATAAILPEVPGYEILGELGRGGMGVVYQARHTRLKRLVALKMIRAGAHAGPEDLARFQAEAEAVARLEHPHIVRLHEIGERHGQPYFSLEYCPGGSLQAKLAGAPQPPPEAAELVEVLARAAEAAHRQGIIHRDLKPANVLLAADGTPKIADFGLAKRLDEAGHTAPGAVLGTPSYMAPEQIPGAGPAVGPSADVYALGAILYECLTGRPPFRGTSPLETLDQVRFQEPVPPTRLQPRMPRDLELICLMCLHKEPRRRYASAGQLADELRRFLRNEPLVHTRRVGRAERVVRWCRRYPWFAGLWAALVLVLAAGFGGITWKWLDAEAEKVAKEYQREQAEKARQLAAEKAAAEGRAKLEAERATTKATAAFQKEQAESYLRGVVLADREWHADNLGRCLQLLRDCPADLRRWEWGYLWRRCHLDLFPVAGHTGAVTALAYSPDGRYFASASRDGTAKVWRAADGRLVQTFTGHGQQVTCLAFHPEKPDRVATGGRDGSVRIWNAATGKEVVSPLRVGGVVRTLAFRPDGARLVAGTTGAAGKGGELSAWDVQSGKEVRRWPGHRGGIYCVAFAPDGGPLASAGADGTVRLWDADSWQQDRVLKEEAGSGEALAFNPDGSWLAVSTLVGKIRIWDMRRPASVPLVIGWHDYTVTGLAFSPDGARLASSGRDRVVKIWDWVAHVRDLRAGKYADMLPLYETVTLRGHTAPVSAVAWDTDGRRLASGGEDGTVKVWDADREPGSRFLVRRERGTVEALAMSRDGRRLAVADWVLPKKDTDLVPHSVTVWDVARGRAEKKFTRRTTFIRALAFLDREGNLLAYGSDDRTVTVWDLATDRKVPLRGHTRPVCALAMSPDGRHLASAGGVGGPLGLTGRDKPGEVLLWDLEDLGRAPVRLGGHTLAVTSLAFHPDGRRLASAGCDQLVKIWDVRAGREDGAPLKHAGQVSGIAFSPDGSRLSAVTLNEKVVVWELAPGGAAPRQQFSLPGHVGIMLALAYSPDGRRLATAAPRQARVEVKIWDTETGLELLTLPGHRGWVNCVLFSPDGRTLYSGGSDGTVRAWDGGLSDVAK